MSTAAPYNRDLVTAALMGFTAGYTTANTKVRFNTFGGMMTGNTVKVGISLQQKEWGWAGVYMTCILLFALGTVFALFMIQRLGTNAQRAFLLIFLFDIADFPVDEPSQPCQQIGLLQPSRHRVFAGRQFLRAASSASQRPAFARRPCRQRLSGHAQR